MNAAEHLAWAKERALEYVDTDPAMAFTSLVSDLRKHPDLADHGGIELGGMLLLGGHLSTRGHLSTPAAMREHIEGCQ